MRPIPACLAGGLMALAGACSDPNPLPPANLINTVDTVVVYAISGTPVYQPSGYSTTERLPVRLDASTSADFGYDIAADGRHVLLPAKLIGQSGFGTDPGLLPTSTPFDSITIAEVNGYLTLDTVTVQAGDVLYVRGRVSPLCYLGLPTYAKAEVLAFDEPARTIQFRILVNGNCGYRSLEPGQPKR